MNQPSLLDVPLSEVCTHSLDKPTPMQHELKRRENQMWKVLDRMRLGPATTEELNSICYRFGAWFGELKALGAAIDKQKVAESHLYRYTLVKDID